MYDPFDESGPSTAAQRTAYLARSDRGHAAATRAASAIDLVTIHAADPTGRVAIGPLGGASADAYAVIGAPLSSEELLAAIEAGVPGVVARVGPGGASVLLGVLDRGARTRPCPPTAELVAEERIVLRVGEARLELRADGRVDLSGSEVQTRATRSNKIKGASVRIN